MALIYKATSEIFVKEKCQCCCQLSNWTQEITQFWVPSSRQKLEYI